MGTGTGNLRLKDAVLRVSKEIGKVNGYSVHEMNKCGKHAYYIAGEGKWAVFVAVLPDSIDLASVDSEAFFKNAIEELKRKEG